jgi:branched-chain amino acid transport system ATP-binding protein
MSAALDVRGLTVSFGGLDVVNDVSFHVDAGQIAGLIGPNGAGKTTTIDALCGFVPYRAGRLTLGATRLDGMKAHQRARAGLVRTFQSIELFDDLTVRENLLVAATPSRWWGVFVDAVAPTRRARDVDVSFALERVGLHALADARPPELSHGQRRLVGVARAVATHPSVVLLDEPAAGLDPSETAALATVVRALSAEGIAVLLVDHDMTLVLEVCETLTVLDVGEVIAQGPTHAVRHDPAVVAAYLGDVS